MGDRVTILAISAIPAVKFCHKRPAFSRETPWRATRSGVRHQSPDQANLRPRSWISPAPSDGFRVFGPVMAAELRFCALELKRKSRKSRKRPKVLAQCSFRKVSVAWEGKGRNGFEQETEEPRSC
jgi:hypothetical protein